MCTSHRSNSLYKKWSWCHMRAPKSLPPLTACFLTNCSKTWRENISHKPEMFTRQKVHSLSFKTHHLPLYLSVSAGSKGLQLRRSTAAFSQPLKNMDPAVFLQKRYADKCTKNDPAGEVFLWRDICTLLETLGVVVATARLKKHSQVQKNQLISWFHWERIPLSVYEPL